MEAKVTLFSSKKTLNFGGNLKRITQPLVMGILNVTPDSFYDGGRHAQGEKMKSQIEVLLREGADIIDIGGYSSRPGAEDITEAEEQKRVLAAVRAVRDLSGEVVISIDTFRSRIAHAALDQGANMINDISGGQMDDQMFDTVAKWQVPYVLMHMRGTPQDMNEKTDYTYLITEIATYFVNKITQLQEKGVHDIILDPGFGFAKTIDQNYEILRSLDYFKLLQYPLLVGLSRKSMIYKPLGTTASESLNGTTVLNTLALNNGASLLRVHDVKSAKEAVKLFKLTYP